MDKAQQNKLNEITLKRLEQENKQKAIAHYLELVDQLLQPIINLENTLVNQELNEFLTIQDLQDLAKELLSEIKAIKLIKYPCVTLDEYLKDLEQLTA